MTKRVLKKHEGNMLEAFSAVLTIMLIAIILVFFIGAMHNLEAKDAVDVVARRYLLQMETEGRLENPSELQSALTQKGLSAIDISGTTVSQRDYGQPIYLAIKGTLQTQEIRFDAERFCLERSVGAVPITIRMSSTAKC